MSTTHPTASDIDSSGSQIANIRFKRSTAAIWRSVNPILLSGEPGYETDTKQWKIGDGTTRYNDLDYKVGGSSSSIAWGNITGKPSSFVPSAHTHPVSEITGFQAAVSANTDVATLKAIVGTGITDGDTVVNTLAEMLAVFSTYQEGVNIATILTNIQNKIITGISVTGTTTKTATVTFADNTTISATFTDLNTGSGGGGIVDVSIVSGSTNAVAGGAVFTALALKAPLVSPAFTGNPTAVTQTVGDNSTKLATTAFVEASIAAEAYYFGLQFSGAGTALDPFQALGSKQVHSSGSSVVIANNKTWLVIDGVGTFTNVAVTLPSNPVDLQQVDITADDVISAFSVLPNTGQTIKQASAPNTMAAGETISYRFTNATWYRL